MLRLGGRHNTNVMNRNLATVPPLSLEMSVTRFERFFCYLTICFGFAGVALFSIDLGILTLFPFRILLIALWLLFVTRALVQGKVIVPVTTVKGYVLFLGLWVTYAVISLAWAASKADSIRHIAFLFMGISVIFFAVYYLRTREDLRRLYWIWVGVSLALVLLGFWEHLTGQHPPVSGYSEERLASLAPYVVAQVRKVPTGVFTNPNDYATFLALSLPFLLGFIRYGSRKWVCLAAIGVALASFYLIVTTGSRANLLAVLVEVTFLFLFLTKLSQKARLVLVGALALGILFTLAPDPIQGIVQKVTEQLGSIPAQVEAGTGSATVRLNLVRNGLDFVYRTAGLGVGAGNAEYWMANFSRYDTAGILNPHNWWLEILINYGLFIFFGYVAMYLGLLRRLWRDWRMSKDRAERMTAEALLVALVGFTVASVSSSSIMAFHPKWLFFAFVFTFISYYERQARKVG